MHENFNIPLEPFHFMSCLMLLFSPMNQPCRLTSIVLDGPKKALRWEQHFGFSNIFFLQSATLEKVLWPSKMIIKNYSAWKNKACQKSDGCSGRFLLNSAPRLWTKGLPSEAADALSVMTAGLIPSVQGHHTDWTDCGISAVIIRMNCCGFRLSC